MRIVYIGTIKFSKSLLIKLLKFDLQIVGLCTNNKSKNISDYADLKPICIKHKIPYKVIKDINSKSSINWISRLQPDYIFCFGWSSLLNKQILEIPKLGTLGYHPTKLPYNRGRHPLIWSLVLGLNSSASSFFFIDEGIDSGDILSQKNFKIHNSDNAQTLYDKIIKIALSQVDEFIPNLLSKKYKLVKQNHLKSNYWRKRNMSDGKIDFRMSSTTIYNLVRGLTKPYVGAHIEYKKKIIKIWKVKIIKNRLPNIECGKVISTYKNSLIVKTSTNAIKILKHEFDSMPVKGEYL